MASRSARRLLIAAGFWAAVSTFPLPAAATAQADKASSAPAPDPFYAMLLRDGGYAYDRGDFASAARDLRLACFGYLDLPVPLAGCLARLGAAQAKANDAEGFAETFRRVVEVEERFGAYAQADVPAAVRAAFEERVAAAIPAATLAQVPAFAPLAARKAEAERLAKLPPKQRRRELEAQQKPATGTAAAARPPATAKPAPATAKQTPGTAKPPAAAPAATLAESLERVRRLLATGGAGELREALKLAREAAEANPASREAQHLAGEAAYRSARWQDAAAFFKRGGDPGDARPELLFYLAVALYESGERAAAATALERSLPNLERTPYVDSYARRILGQRAGGTGGR